jgi:hypothetical protein
VEDRLFPSVSLGLTSHPSIFALYSPEIKLQAGFGGTNGELAAAMQYTIQG